MSFYIVDQFKSLFATVPQCAEIADVSTKWIYKLIDDGVINQVTIGSFVFVERESLHDWMNTKRKPGRPKSRP